MVYRFCQQTMCFKQNIFMDYQALRSGADSIWGRSALCNEIIQSLKIPCVYIYIYISYYVGMYAYIYIYDTYVMCVPIFS